MKVQLWSIDRVQPYPANPRVNDQAVEAVAKSIEAFGFRQPVVVDEAGVIIVGHTRWKAAKRLGMAKVPVHIATGLTEAQIKAYRLADNKTAELAEWDKELLPLELRELQALDFDLGLVGFSQDELSEIFGETVQEGLTDPDAIPEPPDEPVTKPGDLWVLGEHRLLCGDSSNPEHVDRLIDGAAIHLVNTDPPYNVKVEPRSNNAIAAGLSSFTNDAAAKKRRTATHHQGLDLARHPEKAKPTGKKMRAKDRPLANDFVSDEAFTELLHAWFGNISRVLLPGRAFYCWGGYANVANYPPVLKACGFYFSQTIIWDKQHPVLTRKDFMGAHEWCFYCWKEGAAHVFLGPNNVPDLWHVKKVNPNKMVHLCLHPDALVLSEAGFRAIRTVQVGDRVLSGDGTFHGVEHVSSHPYASEHLYRIVAKGGNTAVEASDNHPFLIWRPAKRAVSWMRADEVRHGDYTMTPVLAESGADPFPAEDCSRMEHDGRDYSLRQVKRVDQVRYSGDVWNLSIEGHPSFQTAVGLSHNTEKPVELAVRAMQYSSRTGENVLDLFGGSGSTLIAAEQTGRRAFLMELDALYCDTIVQRYENFTGKKADRIAADEKTPAEAGVGGKR
jgi:DNA modification methylase